MYHYGRYYEWKRGDSVTPVYMLGGIKSHPSKPAADWYSFREVLPPTSRPGKKPKDPPTFVLELGCQYQRDIAQLALVEITQERAFDLARQNDGTDFS